MALLSGVDSPRTGAPETESKCAGKPETETSAFSGTQGEEEEVPWVSHPSRLHSQV